ncbi:hypothetical protein LTR53_007913 [Teratosphaeriaceae sp. CCFEE 6253]|nr:hypothetical protein LTR53_007913 [Teratosphaeriaceae sp. CCFEE 6253]
MPVYSILKGTAGLLVGLLSPDSLSRLEAQLDTILRSNHNRSSHDAGDQLRTLHCLAIMHLVASTAHEHPALTSSFYETQELLASTQPGTEAWTPAETLKYFTSASKVPKTIQLIVLQAMWACQAHAESFDDRLATLRLANELMGAIPDDLKDAWCACNNNVVQKLQQKALICHQSKVIQLYAFAFISQLCKPVTLQISVVEAIRHALADHHTYTEMAHISLGVFLPHCMRAVMDVGTTASLLEHVLVALSHSSQARIVESADSLAEALEQLSQLSLDNDSIAEAIGAMLSKDVFAQKLRALPLTFDGRVSSPCASICDFTSRSARNKMAHGLSSLLLRCAFQTQHSGASLPTSTLDLLLDLHAASAVNAPLCVHHQPVRQDSRTPIAFVEHEGTPSEAAADWRAALQSHLASTSREQYEALSKTFAQACQDLETRCENVERPLRDARAERERIAEECGQLQEAYAELEAQAIDRRLHYEALETEHDECMRSLASAKKEIYDLHQRADDLVQQLETSKREAEYNLNESKRARETAELQHATELAKKVEELEELQERHTDTGADLQQSTASLATLSSQLQDAQAARESLQAQVEGLTIDLRVKTADVANLERVTGETTEARAHLQSALHAVRDELNQEKRNHERNVQQVKEQSRQNMEAANATHNGVIDTMAAQHGEEVADLERQVADGEQQAKRLERKCRQKEDQITDANAMRANLLAALGGGPGLQTQPSLPHRTRTSSRPQTEPATQGAPSPGTPSSVMDVDSQAFDGKASYASNASSTQSRHEPTPKRAKPRKSIRVASPAKARVAIGGKGMRASLAARSTTMTRRLPLSTVSVNSSPLKGGLRTPVKGISRGGDDGFGESTLDEYELGLRSTDGKPEEDGGI